MTQVAENGLTKKVIIGLYSNFTGYIYVYIDCKFNRNLMN